MVLAFFRENAEVVGPLLAAALEGEWRDDSLLREALQRPSM